MIIVIFWLIFAILVGVFASKNGRSGFLALLVAVILSPLIAFIIYALLGKSSEASRQFIEQEERLRAEIRKQLEAENAKDNERV